jgi:hypothetical protein
VSTLPIGDLFQPVSGNRLRFGRKQRDTGGSERSQEAEWARVYGNSLTPVHTSQLLSYLRRADLHVGHLFNFNVSALAAGGWKRVRYLRVKFLMSATCCR